MNNLAATLRGQGQLDEAAAMLKEVLEKMRRILGEEHPNTISAMNNLAATLGDHGQLEEAMAMMTEVLEKGRRILGEEHPLTRSAAKNLAILASMRGVLPDAEHPLLSSLLPSASTCATTDSDTLTFTRRTYISLLIILLRAEHPVTPKLLIIPATTF